MWRGDWLWNFTWEVVDSLIQGLMALDCVRGSLECTQIALRDRTHNQELS